MEQEIRDFLEAFKKQNDDQARKAMITGRLISKSNKEQDNFTKELKKSVDQLKKEGKLKDEELENLKNFNEEMREAEKTVNKFGSDLDKAGDAINPFVRTIGKLGDASGEGAKNFETLAGAFEQFGMTGGILAKLAESLDFTLDTFEGLSQVGATFGNDMLAMRQAAADARLPLSEFAGLVADNSEALATLFTTTSQGVRRLGLFTKGIRDAAGDEGLFGLGVTVEELNDYLGTFLERQRFLNRQTELSEQEVVAATIAYTKELDLLAKITGTQRKQLDEEVKAQQADAVFQRALRGMNEDQRTQANLLVASLAKVNPALAEQAKSIIATGSGFGDFGQLLMGTNNEFVSVLKNFRGLVDSGQSATDILGSLGQTGRNFNANFPDPEVFRFGMGAFNELGVSMEQLALITGQSIDAVREQQAEQARVNKVLGPFREAMRNVQAAFETIKVDFLQAIVPGINMFVDFLKGPFKDTVAKVGEFIAGMKPEDLSKGLLIALGGTILFDMAKQIAIVTAGTAAGIAIAGGGMGGAGALLGGAALAGGGILMAEKAESTGGKLAGVGAGAAGGAITGAKLGMFLGPKGALVGGLLGALIGGGTAAYKGFFDENSRQLGTLGATGQTFEPATRMLQIEKGERVLDQQETEAFNAGTSMTGVVTAINGLQETMNSVVASLNTGNAVNMAIERNTKKTVTQVASLGSSIV